MGICYRPPNPKKIQSKKVTFADSPHLTQSDPKSDFLAQKETQSNLFGSKSHFWGHFESLPVLLFLVLGDFLFFFLTRILLAFLCAFPLFFQGQKDFRGSAGVQILVF